MFELITSTLVILDSTSTPGHQVIEHPWCRGALCLVTITSTVVTCLVKCLVSHTVSFLSLVTSTPGDPRCRGAVCLVTITSTVLSCLVRCLVLPYLSFLFFITSTPGHQVNGRPGCWGSVCLVTLTSQVMTLIILTNTVVTCLVSCLVLHSLSFLILVTSTPRHQVIGHTSCRGPVCLVTTTIIVLTCLVKCLILDTVSFLSMVTSGSISSLVSRLVVWGLFSYP